MEGVAAGVPYVVVPPETGRAGRARPWWAGTSCDPPRTEQALAAALPLAGLDAWRVYLGLPLTGARTPAGGPESSATRTRCSRCYGPVVVRAADEFPAALAAAAGRAGLGGGRLGLLGGSIGALVAQEVAADTRWTRSCWSAR